MSLYRVDFEPLTANPHVKLSAHARSRMPANPGRYVCTTPLVLGSWAYGATAAQAKRRMAERVRQLRADGSL